MTKLDNNNKNNLLTIMLDRVSTGGSTVFSIWQKRNQPRLWFRFVFLGIHNDIV